MDLKEKEFEDGDWIHWAQGGDPWMALVIVVLQVP
jgi:hypothetical protein